MLAAKVQSEFEWTVLKTFTYPGNGSSPISSRQIRFLSNTKKLELLTGMYLRTNQEETRALVENGDISLTRHM